MRVIKREFFNVSRSDVFRIIPIGDIHMGAAACDEDLLRAVVKRIKDDGQAWWIGMGDMADYIILKDPRSSIGTLADWVTLDDLVDLPKAERDRLLDILRPIAPKCLALVCGNHEAAIHKHTERDVYSEIVAGVKGAGGFKTTDRLAIGFYGWLQLAFYRSATKKQRGTMININLHHGYTAGRLAGSKALNMQRWLWTHNADIVLMGHCHDTKIQPEAVEEIDRGGHVTTRTRCGAYTGTFLHTTNEDGPATYAERRGYFPLPYGGVEIELRPGQKERRGRIRMIYSY